MTPIDEYDEGAPQPNRVGNLYTKGLMLIPATIDTPDYSHWLNDPEVVRFSELRHRLGQWTYEDCRKYIAGFDQVKNCMWTINVVGANMYIGNITTHYDPHNNVMQIGMLIGEKWAWGRRFGREAWLAVMQWAKKEGVRQLEAGCMVSNIGMRGIMKACDMGNCATMNDHFLLDGKPEPVMFFRKTL